MMQQCIETVKNHIGLLFAESRQNLDSNGPKKSPLIHEIRELLYRSESIQTLSAEGLLHLNVAIKEQVVQMISSQLGSVQSLTDLSPTELVVKLGTFWSAYVKLSYICCRVLDRLDYLFRVFQAKVPGLMTISTLFLEILADFVGNQPLSDKLLVDFTAHFSAIQERGKNPLQLRQFFQCVQACLGLSAVEIKGIVMKARDDYTFHKRDQLIERVNTVSLQHYEQKYGVSFFKDLQQLAYKDQIHRITQVFYEEKDHLAMFNISQLLEQDCSTKLSSVILWRNSSELIGQANGFRGLIDELKPTSEGVKNIEQINRFKQLYSKMETQAEPYLHEAIKLYLQDKWGAEIRQKLGNYQQFTKRLINLYNRVRAVFRIFNNSFQIQNLLNKGVETMLSNTFQPINDTYSGKNGEGAKEVAQYAHITLRKLYSGPSPQQRSNLIFGLDGVIDLFRIMVYKQDFLKTYTDLLMQRIAQDLNIADASAFEPSMHAETQMLEKLRRETNFSEISKIDTLLRDASYSHQKTKAFKRQTAMTLINQVVLKGDPNLWSRQQNFKFTSVPKIIEAETLKLEKYFREVGELKISIEYESGFSQIECMSNGRPLRFELKNLAVAIIFLIDEAPLKKLTFAQLKLALAPKKEALKLLCRTIVELLFMGLLISPDKKIQNEPTLCTVKDDNILEANRQFDFEFSMKSYWEGSKPFPNVSKTLVRYQQIIDYMPEWLRKIFREALKQTASREQQMEILKMFIVRILKESERRKQVCSLSKIMTYVRSQRALRNPPSEREVSATLEQLILSEYCERDENDYQVYRYMA